MGSEVGEIRLKGINAQLFSRSDAIQDGVSPISVLDDAEGAAARMRYV
jgi:hypothetical protein